MYMHSEQPVEVYTDGLKVKEISVGSHHNLFLGEDDQLYGFGAKLNGQIDGTNYSN